MPSDKIQMNEMPLTFVFWVYGFGSRGFGVWGDIFCIAVPGVGIGILSQAPVCIAYQAVLYNG